MNSQELKSYINSALGNSLKLLLPSYWWKKVFGTVIDNVVSTEDIKTINGESIIGEGDLSSIPVFYNKEDLEATEAPLGRIVSVVSGGSTFADFEDCYVISEEDLEGDFSSAVLPKCTKIDKLVFHIPENYNATSAVAMYFRDITNSFAIQLYIAPADDNDPCLVYGIYGTPTWDRSIVFYRSDTGYINNSAADLLNEEIKKWDMRLLALLADGEAITDPQKFKEVAEVFNTVLSREIVVPYDSVPYIKSESWDRLSKDYIVSSEEDLTKLSADTGSIAKVIEQGGVREIAWEDLYILDESELNEDYLNTPELFSTIKEIKINESIISPDTEKTVIINLYNPDSYTGDIGSVEAYSLVCEPGFIYFSDFVETEIILYETSVGVNTDGLQQVNQLFEEKDLKLFVMRSNLANKEEAIAYISQYITLYTGQKEQFKGAYIKGNSWEKIATSNADDSRELYLWNTNDSGEPTPLTEEQKAYNKESLKLFHQGKCRLWTKDPRTENLSIINFTSCIYAEEELFYGLVSLSFDNKINLCVYTLAVSEQGVPLDDNYESVFVDNQLSTTSTNAVQNRVITEALNNKADKTAIPTKTSQLTNNSGFLTQHQDISHLASKTYVDEKDATKQDKLVSGTSIKTINGNSILGSGDIKVVADTSNLATKSEVNAKQDKITDLETIRSGATKGATAIQKVKTINGESLVGDGDVAVVTKTLYDNLIEEIVTNEEVYAAAVNDLNTRLNTTNITLNTTIETTESIITDINTLTTRVSSNEEVTATSYNELNERINNNYQEGVDTYATKTALNNEVVSINTAIVENEEVIAATLNDLLSQIEALRVRIEQLENA